MILIESLLRDNLQGLWSAFPSHHRSPAVTDDLLQSASLHLLVNGGDHEDLFQSAFLQSGTANTLGIGGPELRQPVFDALVDKVGCVDAEDKIDCLRNIDESDFDAAVYNSTKSLDLSYTVKCFMSC